MIRLNVMKLALTWRIWWGRWFLYQQDFGNESIFHISAKLNSHNDQISERFSKSECISEKTYDLSFSKKILSEEPLTGHVKWVVDASITRRLYSCGAPHIDFNTMSTKIFPTGLAEQQTTYHSYNDHEVWFNLVHWFNSILFLSIWFCHFVDLQVYGN